MAFHGGQRKTPNDNHQINLNDNPEMKEMLKKMHDRHWQDWLDISIPVLNNQTPREAAKTRNGRERLEALFNDFHQSNLKITALNNNGQLPIDLCFLREELGFCRKLTCNFMNASFQENRLAQIICS